MNPYQALYEESPNMVFFFRNDGQVLEHNAAVCTELGYVRTDQINICQVFPGLLSREDSVLGQMQQLAQGLTETVAYRKNQTCFPVEVKFVHLDGEEQIGSCIAKSIQKRRGLTKELEDAQERVWQVHQERSHLVANVTHELRTPVNGIRGLTDALEESELSVAQREAVEMIRQCCQNMTRIIDNILDYSKLDAGKFIFENRPFSFRRMMDQILQMNQPLANEKGLRLLCTIAEDIPDQVVGDELRISQIINNLLSNALKFTMIGQISMDVIKTREAQGQLELFFLVADTGIGISKEEKERLFKSFSQVDASISRRFGGTGLGLSIVKELVEAMGGSINVESEKGRGSTFSFSIPLRREGSEQMKSVLHPLGQLAGSLEERLQKQQVRRKVQEEQDMVQRMYSLGTPENRKEIQGHLEKMILCIEMKNWHKADAFAGQIKQLVAKDSQELKRVAFRLQMTLRKEEYGQAVEAYEAFLQAWNDYLKGESGGGDAADRE